MSERVGGAGRRERLARYRGVRKRASPRSVASVFEDLVVEALDTLPPLVRDRISNVAIVVEERPDPGKLSRLGYDPRQELLGLYEGIPQTQRSAGYHGAIPDRITIFRQPILAQVGAGGRAAIVREVRQTVVHEVAHHFGIGDHELEELEGFKRHLL